MSDYLTSAGLDVPRVADFRTIMRSEFEAQLDARGLPSDIDWDRDVVVSLLLDVTALRLDALAEGLQAVYDATDVNAATGYQLDNLALLVGVTREDATYSQATVTLTGTVGTIITAGKLVEGGGPDGTSRWRTTEDVTIGGGGTVDVVVQAVDVGEIEAAIGEIDAIVSTQAGWTAVTNAAAAEAGNPLESDATLRARRRRATQAGSISAAALRAELEALDFVEAAIVLENTSGATATVSGISLDPHSICAIVRPSGLTDDQKEELAQVIYEGKSPGIGTNGTDVVVDVTQPDGTTETIRARYATTSAVNVVVNVTAVEAGYTEAGITAALQTAVEAVFDDLEVGETLRILRVYNAIADVEGLLAATVTLNGFSTDRVPTNGGQRLVIGTFSVT